jgi:hypothetical protein
MKFYTLDHGVYGSVVVIANSKEEAYNIMLDEHPRTNRFNDFERITEKEIKVGTSHSNWGDL